MRAKDLNVNNSLHSKCWASVEAILRCDLYDTLIELKCLWNKYNKFTQGRKLYSPRIWVQVGVILIADSAAMTAMWYCHLCYISISATRSSDHAQLLWMILNTRKGKSFRCGNRALQTSTNQARKYNYIEACD